MPVFIPAFSSMYKIIYFLEEGCACRDQWSFEDAPGSLCYHRGTTQTLAERLLQLLFHHRNAKHLPQGFGRCGRISKTQCFLYLFVINYTHMVWKRWSFQLMCIGYNGPIQVVGDGTTALRNFKKCSQFQSCLQLIPNIFNLWYFRGLLQQPTACFFLASWNPTKASCSMGCLQAPTQSNCLNVVVLPTLHTSKGWTSPVLGTSLPYFGSFKVRSHHPCCIQLLLTLGTMLWRTCPTQDIPKDIPKLDKIGVNLGVSCHTYKPSFCNWEKQHGKPFFPSHSWQHLRWANSPSWGLVSGPLA